MSTYYTVQKESSAELIDRKSRFIANCKPVSTEDDAIAFINQIKSSHRTASHNVYAYCIRQGNTTRYSDDGEPSGTAGTPTLNVLLKNNITDTAMVITRYFGGTLLGTGGLVRAYSNSAKMALDTSKIIKMSKCYTCELICSYNQYGTVKNTIFGVSGNIETTEFLDNVKLRFYISINSINSLQKNLSNETSGSVQATIIDENYKELG